MTELSPNVQQALSQFLLRLGDDALVLSQRLSEWCGHGPILEEDIAMTNIALDLVGRAESLLKLAGELEGADRSEDDLAYHRDENEFVNCQLVERPRGDFGVTMARQFLFDAYAWLHYTELANSSHEGLAALAAKSLKEATYHLRHSREWVLRLGDGTAESNQRVQAGIDAMWAYTGELFYTDAVDDTLVEAGLIVDLKALEPKYRQLVQDTLTEARLTVPEDPAFWPMSARKGQHSEYLGHMLASMQIVARSHPGASW